MICSLSCFLLITNHTDPPSGSSEWACVHVVAEVACYERCDVKAETIREKRSRGLQEFGTIIVKKAGLATKKAEPTANSTWIQRR